MSFEYPAFEISSHYDVLEARRQLLFTALDCFAGKPPTDVPTKGAVGDRAYLPSMPQESLKVIAGKVGMSLETVERARQEVNRFGRDPSSECVSAMKTHRVVGLGESHYIGNPHRAFGADIMSKLKDAGATHLAIEEPATSQPIIDAWLKGAKLDPKVLQDILQDSQFLKMLENAKAAGLKVVCVDNRECEEDDRDMFMAKNIGNVLDENPDNKVVFWVGNTHLGKISEGGEEDEVDPPLVTQAAELLRKKYSTSTFASITHRHSHLYLGQILNDVSLPVSFSTREAKTIANMTKVGGVARFGDWENVIVYPAPVGK